MAKAESAVRVTVTGEGPVDEIVRRAHELGVLGWVRQDEDALRVHAEGDQGPVSELIEPLGGEVEQVKPEGHEQFAVRGVSAGVFVIQEHAATSRHFDLRLEVDGVMKSWAVPKGPSMDPAAKRMAIAVDDHGMDHNDYESDRVIIWDRGTYEQGGRVPWPEAIERGHAVFVLHGEKLAGGFALQRTRAQWLLIKRKDDDARPGSDVVAERPESVVSGQTLDDLLG